MLYYTLKTRDDIEKIVARKAKGLSAEKVTNPTTTDNSLSPSVTYYRN